MNAIKRITAFLLPLTAIAVCAQSAVEQRYDEARKLNDKAEYMAAARIFRDVQEQAKGSGENDLYIRSIVAEGECYYALTLISSVKECLDRANKEYKACKSSADTQTRLEWQEAILKLEGAYYYCLTDVDSTAFLLADEAYMSCLAVIDTLNRSTSFDDEEAAVIIHRERLSLLYKMSRYKEALAEAQTVWNYYADMGYVSHPRETSDERMNAQFIDAARSYMLVLARLHRFDEAAVVLQVLSQEVLQSPAMLRTRGKFAMLWHDYDGSGNIDEAKACYSQYIRYLKTHVARTLPTMSESQREQYWLNLHDFLYDCYRLENYAPEMLYDLALFSKGYLMEYKNKQAKPCTWQDVKKSLPDGTCAIEFVQYRGKGERNRLGALVVTKQSTHPVFVPIAAVDSLKSIALGGFVNVELALSSANGADKNSLYTSADLARAIWSKPLLEATDGASIVYFAADGMLQQLAIEYMCPDKARSCRRLTSTRILAGERQRIDSRSMLLIGDIDYDTPHTLRQQGNDEAAYRFFLPYSEWIDPLPGTRSEIDSITHLRQSDEDLRLTGFDATDEAFCRMSPYFNVVHVATHGFFVGTLESGTDLKPLLRDNVLSESGLVFAGAQYALHDSLYGADFADGVLSAKELSELPLESVDLMVLSACQTGLGYITADGVYGIQRALKQAGVRAMIVSLWSVDDEATAIMMRNFYKHLRNGSEVHDAFRQARDELMKEVRRVFHAGALGSRKKMKFAAPEYANAFILIDIL